MKHSSPLAIVAFLAFGLAGVPAEAEPFIRDANGLVVASPAGFAEEGVPMGYLTIDGATTTIFFGRKKESSAFLQWWSGSYGALYYRSVDCSGPALISNPQAALGTVPSVLIAGGSHAWLHVADSMKGIGKVTVQSRRIPGKECIATGGGEVEVWRAKPAINLGAIFTPPFSIH